MLTLLRKGENSIVLERDLSQRLRNKYLGQISYFWAKSQKSIVHEGNLAQISLSMIWAEGPFCCEAAYLAEGQSLSGARWLTPAGTPPLRLARGCLLPCYLGTPKGFRDIQIQPLECNMQKPGVPFRLGVHLLQAKFIQMAQLHTREKSSLYVNPSLFFIFLVQF